MLQFLAIDTGGTKTRFVVFDINMNIIESTKTSGFGFASDENEDIPELRLTLNKLAKAYDICSVAVNLGGKNKEQITGILKACFKDCPLSVHRESEGAASIAFAKRFGANAVLLAGTGTIAIAFNEDDKKIISGGWGMNISDGGSGYYIGLEALKHSLCALDKTCVLTPLQQEITGCKEPIPPSSDAGIICRLRDKVRERIFPLDRKHIAAFAKTVVAHCENGEADALAIMNDAGALMGMLCVDCINKLLPFKVDKIAVSGGLVNVRRYWQAAFEDTIKNFGAANEIIYKADGILLGTQQIAIEQYKEV